MSFIERFPWTKGTIGVGLGGLIGFVIVAWFRLAFGEIFPAGYDTMIWALVALAGVGGGVGIGKRATDYTLEAIKTGDATIVAAVVGPPKVPDSEASTPVLTKADAQKVAKAFEARQREIDGEQG